MRIQDVLTLIKYQETHDETIRTVKNTDFYESHFQMTHMTKIDRFFNLEGSENDSTEINFDKFNEVVESIAYNENILSS